VTTASGLEMRPPPVALEVPERSVADQDHIAAASTVAAVRTPLRDVGFAPEARRAIASGPSLNMDTSPILH
jgi:hypothetical protein